MAATSSAVPSLPLLAEESMGSDGSDGSERPPGAVEDDDAEKEQLYDIENSRPSSVRSHIRPFASRSLRSMASIRSRKSLRSSGALSVRSSKGVVPVSEAGGEDDGDGDVSEDEAVPPARLNRSVSTFGRIMTLKAQVESDGAVSELVRRFDDDVKDEVIMVGQVSAAALERQDKIWHESRAAAMEHEAQLVRKRREVAKKQEMAAKARVQREADKRIAGQRERMRREQENQQVRLRELREAFRRAEDQLSSVLARRKGEVQTHYGEMEYVDGYYTGVKQRRYQVDWSRTPQPIQIKLNRVRAVKDKLPRGRYVMLVSMFDRLGGYAMRWSRVKGQEWCAASMPFRHQGSHRDLSMRIDSNVFTVAPSKIDLRPHMVLVFELFLLQGHAAPLDTVVAWGAFPISTPSFNVVRGKFKVPLMRGEVDSSIDKWSNMERLYAYDLDNWLANLYFDVHHLPRYAAGQKEYEVELLHTSEMLGFPDRDSGSSADEESHGLGLSAAASTRRLASPPPSQVRGAVSHRSSHRRSARQLRADSDSSDDDSQREKHRRGGQHTARSRGSRRRQAQAGRRGTATSTTRVGAPVQLHASAADPDDDGGDDVGSGDQDSYDYDSYDSYTGEESADDGDDDNQEEVTSTRAIRPSDLRLASRASDRVPLIAATAARDAEIAAEPRSALRRRRGDSDDTAVAAAASARADPHSQAKGNKGPSRSFRDGTMLQRDQQGLLYRQHQGIDITDVRHIVPLSVQRNGAGVGFAGVGSDGDNSNNGHDGDDDYDDDDDVLGNGAGGGGVSGGWAAAEEEESAMLAVHRISVVEVNQGIRKHQQASEKMQYLQREMLTEMGLSQWRTIEFWITILFLMVVFWLRLFSHYFGQWLFLWMLRVPVSEFNVLLYTVLIVYPDAQMPTSYQAAISVFGTIFNIFVFSFFVAVASWWQSLFHSFGDTPSRFVMVFGLGTVFDGLLCFIVDLGTGNLNGDSFKLYNRFQTVEGNGLPGVFGTVFLNVTLMMLAAFILFNYLLKIHMNGRMVDVYHRIHANEHQFLVPDDNEVSMRELQWICEKAERWRGSDGSRRKIIVTDFRRTDPDDPTWSEHTTHLGIYTVALNGSREIHRQFLRQMDGSIVEAFGDVAAMGSSAASSVSRSGTPMDLLKDCAQDRPFTQAV